MFNLSISRQSSVFYNIQYMSEIGFSFHFLVTF